MLNFRDKNYWLGTDGLNCHSMSYTNVSSLNMFLVQNVPQKSTKFLKPCRLCNHNNNERGICNSNRRNISNLFESYSSSFSFERFVMAKNFFWILFFWDFIIPLTSWCCRNIFLGRANYIDAIYNYINTIFIEDLVPIMVYQFRLDIIPNGPS